MRTITVELGDRSYPVVVGPGAVERLPELLGSAAKVAVVTQDGVPGPPELDRDHDVFTIGDGEEAKSMATVEALCRDFARAGLTRGDLVVAVGGGVVTDTAGFAAACYHRGVPVVHVATTLLAQVDAAIGGKTGVNLPEGKNLVGAFWQPRGVICDTDVLAGLPPRELRSGLGEVAKYHFLTGDDLTGEHMEGMELPEQVARCVAIKAEVVAADEREGGRRAVLNYGHTLGHALETAGGYDLAHGEAVAIGLVFAARLAARLGRIDEARVADHVRVVAGLDLPTAIPPVGADVDLVALMARDKKAVHGLTFALDGPSGVEVVPDVDAGEVARTLEEMR